MTVPISISYQSLSKDRATLYVAFEASTSGWVAVGLGAQRMNGTYLVLGYDKNGEIVVSEEKGKGHGHTPNASRILSKSAVKESGGKTVIEFSLPANGFVTGNSLKAIVAYGAQDNFTSMHSDFSTANLQFASR